MDSAAQLRDYTGNEHKTLLNVVLTHSSSSSTQRRHNMASGTRSHRSQITRGMLGFFVSLRVSLGSSFLLHLTFPRLISSSAYPRSWRACQQNRTVAMLQIDPPPTTTRHETELLRPLPAPATRRWQCPCHPQHWPLQACSRPAASTARETNRHLLMQRSMSSLLLIGA